MANIDKNRSKKVVVILLVIICFVLFGALIIQGYLQLRLLHSVNQIKQTTQANKLIITDQQSKIHRIKLSLHVINRKMTDDLGAWVLPEADHLIRLANISLIINHNTNNAIKLLQISDQQIARLHNPLLIYLRKALAHDIGQLQATTQLDTVGILLRLDAANKLLTSLPIVPHKVTNKIIARSKKKKTTVWQNALRHLQNIIIIRKQNYPVLPLLSAQQRVFIVQSAQLELIQAKWALLHREQKLYLTSLRSVGSFVRLLFAHNITALKSLLLQINKLQQLNINPTQINITASITAINKALRLEQQGKLQ